VAQLGARLDGIEEVVGSNPIGSTKIIACLFTFTFFGAKERIAITSARLEMSSSA
jgi:hypothetical protein